MKKYLMVLALLFTTARAEDVPPSYLKDAVITVTLKNGKTYTFSANTHKVVQRGKDAPDLGNDYSATDEAFIEGFESGVVLGRELQEKARKKNRVTLLAGVGFDGHDVKESKNKVEVTEDRTLVLGLGYQRELEKGVSLGGFIFTNGTAVLGLGRDF